MIDECILLIGASGSGKSTFARKLEFEGYKFINWDQNFDYTIDFNNKALVFNYLNKIRGLIGDEKKVVIDGFILTMDKKLTYFRQLITPNVRVIVTMAPDWFLVRRQVLNAHHWECNIHNKSIERLYKNGIPSHIGYDNLSYVITTDYDYTIYSSKDYLDTYNKLNEVINGKEFVTNLLQREDYDVKYQDIQIENEIYPGYSQSLYTWERIRNLTDWRLKRVLEVGSNHGFFLFKAMDNGAKECIGIEKCQLRLKTARTLRNIKMNPCSFIHGDVEIKTLKERDITLVLNMFHYMKDPENTARKLFTGTKELIAECNPKDQEVFTKIGKEMGFTLSKRIYSDRVNSYTNELREVLLYK